MEVGGDTGDSSFRGFLKVCRAGRAKTEGKRVISWGAIEPMVERVGGGC